MSALNWLLLAVSCFGASWGNKEQGSAESTLKVPAGLVLAPTCGEARQHALHAQPHTHCWYGGAQLQKKFAVATSSTLLGGLWWISLWLLREEQRRSQGGSTHAFQDQKLKTAGGSSREQQ